MGNFFGGGATGLYLFLYVLPGILGALVYEYVVEGEPRDTLDRIAAALVLALVSALSSSLLFGQSLTPNIEVRSETPPDVILGAFLRPKHLALSTLISVAVALSFAAAQNHGWVYGVLRKLKLTKKTSRNDVWQQTLYLYGNRWISLEFKDGRRLVGWPLRFSSSGQPRALLLGDATWYSLDGDGAYIEREVNGPGVYVANFDDVVSMELLE
jgi:hypothetical protein